MCGCVVQTPNTVISCTAHLALLCHGANEEVAPDVVHVRHQDGAVHRCEVRWVDVFLHPGAPVDPLT